MWCLCFWIAQQHSTLPQRFYYLLVRHCENTIVWDNISSSLTYQAGSILTVAHVSIWNTICFPFTSAEYFAYAPRFRGVSEYTTASPLSSSSSVPLVLCTLYTRRWFLECWFVPRPLMHFHSKWSLAPQLLQVFPYAGHISFLGAWRQPQYRHSHLSRRPWLTTCTWSCTSSSTVLCDMADSAALQTSHLHTRPRKVCGS